MDIYSISAKLTFKFLLTGAIVALFQLSTFVILFTVFSIEYLIASTATFILTIVVSFLLQRNFVFTVKGKRAVSAQVSFLVVFVNSLLVLVLNGLIMYGGVEYVYRSAVIWQIISMFILAVYNFFFYRYLFRPHSDII